VLSTKAQIAEIHWALSPARIATYAAAAGCQGPDDPAALDLYLWNAQVSAAFLTPLHLCEVTLRNAVDDALSAKYGQAWPWSSAFEQSLPVTSVGYSAIRQLRNRIAHHEPIFHRGLAEDCRLIGQLIAWRSPQTFHWMMQHQQVTAWLAVKP
jgi:hypothetical protein